MVNELAKDIFYIGANDNTLDLFEAQYPIPNGISYNSYVIMDDKIAIMDTIDKRATNDWLSNLANVLQNKKPDYLIVSHMEPDHAANISNLIEKYSSIKIVSNIKTFGMIEQFFPNLNLKDEQKLIVKENDELNLGKNTLKFIMAPMVHWPEVMVTYEKTNKILFSADAFGKFGTLDTNEEWTDEARRYYINIAGKYGMPVQTLLKKINLLDIQNIYPLHGPMLTNNIKYYIDKYNTWSSYLPEDKGIFIAYTSVYGNTKEVAEKLKESLNSKGVNKIVITDLSRTDISKAVENAFRYDRLVLATTTYDADIFPLMENFISHLISKNYQNRKICIIENGSWAPIAANKIKAKFENSKNLTFINPVITIKSALNNDTLKAIEELADSLLL